MTERHLATVRTVSEIRPIPGADAIECAVIDGWTVVTKKGELKPGSICVYFEIDSVLPIRPEFEFLRKSSYVKKEWLKDGEGFRLRTVRLRKQLSQGLAVPYQVFPEVLHAFHQTRPYDPNGGHFDVTNLLGVTKWDPPVPAELAGKVKGNFPSFIPKTDEERAQNIVEEILVDHKDDVYEVSMKMDGSSMTAYYKDGTLGVCSRNLELKIEDENKDNTFIRLFFDTGLMIALKALGRNVAVQGEAMGPGIQGNRENLKAHQLFVFRIYDIDAGKFLTPEERYSFFDQLKAMGFTGEHVPILNTDLTLPVDVGIEELIKFADGPSLNHPIREGLVYKNKDGSFSFKTISNKYLEECEE